MSGHDRRGFFGELLRSVARAGAEADEVLRSLRGEDAPTEEVGDPEFEIADATPTATTASIEDVRRLCDELGKGDWADDAAAAASLSVRLTHGDGRSRLGGAPPLPPGEPWPTAAGEPVPLALCVDVSDLELLPFESGRLLFFAVPDEPAASRLLLAPGDPPLRSDGPTLPEVPLQASVELVLPAVPRSPELDPTDLEVWTRLRARLARAQGVMLEELVDDYHALHRVLGEPDLVAHTMDEEAAHAEPGTEAADWLLLLQVSSEPEAELCLAPFERLFTWIPKGDLTAGRLDRCRTFLA